MREWRRSYDDQCLVSIFCSTEVNSREGMETFVIDSVLWHAASSTEVNSREGMEVMAGENNKNERGKPYLAELPAREC